MQLIEKRYCAYPYPKVSDDSEYQCLCHERMGNDYWFLPFDACLYTEEGLEKERKAA